MPKKPSDAVSVQLRVPKPLLARVDALAGELSTTRTSIFIMALTSSLDLMEKFMKPSQFLNDPRIIQAVEDMIQGNLDVKEKPQQSPKV